MFNAGNHRFVITFKNIALKTPRIRLVLIFNTMISIFFDIKNKILDIKHEHSNEYYREIIKLQLGAIWEYLTMGLLENFREAICWHKTKHPLLAELYLPLLFVNIYHREKRIGEIDFDWRRFYQIGKNTKYGKEFRMVGHTFSTNPDNFSYYNGKLKLLDYGEKGILDLLISGENDVINDLLSITEKRNKVLEKYYSKKKKGRKK